MYIGYGRLCVCLCDCLSDPRRIPTLGAYCIDPNVTWRNGRGCPLVLCYWADLQLVHWFGCYDNILPNAKCLRVLVLALCLVIKVTTCLENLEMSRKSTAVRETSGENVVRETCLLLTS